MPPEPEAPPRKRFSDVLTRRPAYGKLAAALVFLLVATTGLAQRSSAPQGATGSNPLGLLLSLGPGLAFLVQFFQSTRPKIARSVVVEPDAVLVDGYPIFRRPEVTSVSRSIASIDVRRGVHRAPCELTFASEAQARAFEQILRAPTRAEPSSVELETRWSPTRWRAINVLVPLLGLACTLAGMIALGALLAPAWAVLPPAAFVALYVHATRVPRLAVGTDGIRLTTRFGVRFYGHAQLAQVAGYRYPALFHKAALVLQTDDGKLTIGFGTEALAEQRAGALLAKLQRRLTAFRDAPEPPRLPRIEGTTVEWLRQLRGIVDGKDADHRRLAGSVDELAEALRNPRTDRATRAAAAFGMAGTEEGRLEIAAIATRTVDPLLKDAFDLCREVEARTFAPVVERLRSAH